MRRVSVAAALFMAAAVATASAQSAGVDLPGYFYKHFEGAIGGTYRIVMDLMRTGTTVTGDYYYAAVGVPISFTAASSVTDGGAVTLGEATGKFDRSDREIVSGTFEGRFTSDRAVSGTWTSGDGRTTLPFQLAERYGNGSARVAVLRRLRELTEPGDAVGRIEFVYPQIAPGGAVPSNARTAINASIIAVLSNAYRSDNGSPVAGGLEGAAADFEHRYLAAQRDSERGELDNWWNDAYVTRVRFNDAGILALETLTETYEGGAYPNSTFVDANYDLATGKVITFDELFSSDARAKLSAIAEPSFRKLYNLAPGDSLSAAGFEFPNDEFALNDNFLITPGGLTFQFSAGEIAPHALGAPAIYLPYSEIRALIRQSSVVSRLMK